MDLREVVQAYMQRRMHSWGVFRQLVRLGLTTTTALSVVAALPGALKTGELHALEAFAQSSEEAAVLGVLIEQLASQLDMVADGSPIYPVATTLARIGARNANLTGSIEINLNEGGANLVAVLSPSTKEPNRTPNLNLDLNGTVGDGQVNVQLVGTLDPPQDLSSGVNVNLGGVNMNVRGTAGDANLNFAGNLGNLVTTEIR
jgi:hypothetical protein